MTDTAATEPHEEATLNPHRLPVPHELRSDRFVVRRQHPGDNERDYDAVMNSRETLRTWSDSTWPEDDFTLDANAEDLAGHIDDHERDLAYGFSVMTPDERTLLGSLYLVPAAPSADEYHVDDTDRAALEPYDVRVEFWLRDGTPAELETEFLREVLAWLERDWWFARPVFGSRRDMHERRAAYERAGMRQVARLAAKDGPRVAHFHAP